MGAALAATKRQLLSATGNDKAAVNLLCTFRMTMMHALRTRVVGMPLLANWQVLLDYLGAEMSHAPRERARALYLNRRNYLIRDEILNEGTIDSVTIYVREIVRRALELGAASIVLVHNHPSGDHTPSTADNDLTRHLALAGATMGIVLHDHLIFSASGYTSCRALGLV